MCKQNIEIEVNYHLNWQGQISVEEIKKDIKTLENLGVTHIEINWKSVWGDIELYFQPKITRLETNEEYEKRITEENKRKEKERLIDLHQYNKLKEKLGL